jgi:hypothetical protein
MMMRHHQHAGNRFFRTAADYLLPPGSGGGLVIRNDATGHHVIDAEQEVHNCVGRLGPDAPHENQSPVVYDIDFRPTPNWRAKRQDECVPNTFMPRYNQALVHVNKRGLLIVRCPQLEQGGTRSIGGSPARGTVYMNNLRLGYEYTYGGFTGNPSQKQGGPSTRPGTEDWLGTAEYGGGELTAIFNSPIEGRAGQQLYFSEVPMVYRDHKTGEVLGNALCYENTFDMDEHNHQQLLLPTIIPMTVETIEHLQAGVLFDVTDKLTSMLHPSSGAVEAESIRNFARDEIGRHEMEHGLTLIPPIAMWLRVAALRCGLELANARLYGSTGDHGKRYQSAVEALQSQLVDAIQVFFNHQRMARDRKFGKHQSSMAVEHNQRMPAALAHLNSSSREDKGDDDGFTLQAQRVLHTLQLAQSVMSTLHNLVVAWLKSHWIGTLTSTIATPGKQMKLSARRRHECTVYSPVRPASLTITSAL